MNKEILKDMSYGMFVLSTTYKGKNVGCFVNTVVQITSTSMLVAISINKNNYTNEAIKDSKKFAISVLSQNSSPEVIGKFGFFSSKDIDKFEGFKVSQVDDILIIDEDICGYLICELVDVISVDTHDIFIAKIVDTKKLNDATAMTYDYYHKVIKGNTSKNAPTFIEEEGKNCENTKLYRCTICGHIYDEAKQGVKFEDLPDDWKCPICGVGKELFEEVKSR